MPFHVFIHYSLSPIFSQRSYKKELLDREDIPFEDIKRNMEELEFVNTNLGGHAITIHGIRQLLKAGVKPPAEGWLICEIGCGGGDNLGAIQRWFARKNIPVRFIGIDINKHCIKAAAMKIKALPVTLICSDYKQADLAGREPDIIFSSLFCHHFTDTELIYMLGWMRANARHGFFINDLHRHPLAYYSIYILASIFSRSYLVKNDAPLSVLRGFRKKEWENLLQSAGITGYTISWKWAFRYLITVNKATGLKAP